MFISMLLTYSYNMGARRRLWMPFWPPFSTACERFVETTSSSIIKLIKRIFYGFILNQAKVFLLPKRLPASDRAYPKIPLRRRGKRHHHGGDVRGLVVFWSTVLSVLFLPQESYGAGVFCPRPNPYRG
jgi:hypothetical protein